MKRMLTIMIIFVFIFTSVFITPTQMIFADSTFNEDENTSTADDAAISKDKNTDDVDEPTLDDSAYDIDTNYDEVSEDEYDSDTYQNLLDEIEFDFLPDEDLIKLSEPVSRKDYCEIIIELYEYLVNERTGKNPEIKLPEKTPFKDTSDKYILKAYKLGLIVGKGNGYFKPNDKLKLEEKAVMLYKTLKLVNPEIIKEVGKLNIKSETKINSWAAEALSYLTNHNIITPDEYGYIDPNDTITVEDASEIVDKAAKHSDNEKNDTEDVKASEDQLTNYLIYGYHVINSGQICSAEINLHAPILDSTVLKSMVATSKSSSTSILDTISSKASDLCNKLNASAKVKHKGALFSGSLETDFSMTNKMSSNQELIKHIELHPVAEKYLVYNDVDELQPYLSKGFKTAIDNLDFEGRTYEKKSEGTFTPTSLNASDEEKCNEIFDKYGTHLIARYTLGGRLELNYNLQNTSSLTDQQIAMAAKASYGNTSGSAKVADEKMVENFVSNSTLTFRGVGGIGITGNSAEQISSQYAEWVKSLKDDPDICYVNDFNNSMIPIWDLISDKSKAAALEMAFENISLKRDSMINGYDFNKEDSMKYITNIIVVNGKNKNEAKSKIPEGYNIVCINTKTATVDTNNNSDYYLDANYDTGKPYVYIGYLLSNDKSKAITSLAVMIKQEGDKRKDFTRIDGDLNYKAGGKDLFLYYKTGGDKPLTAISGYYGNQPPIPEGWALPDPSIDLNRGVSGSGDAILIVHR
ncbi:MAC/perforin domain-containing protein [Aminipila sp.]|uniref:MAC/perforin domain-containing protein n=1 Tax=Aminipila sp. TaxID=2060095 RepID=UPI00289D86B5|nr:MAC/perforin domain-containing protein [Aminipila sp.]